MSTSLIFIFLRIPVPPLSTLFPYTTLFRSPRGSGRGRWPGARAGPPPPRRPRPAPAPGRRRRGGGRSEEHTTELQSLAYLVCRPLLEKKNTNLGARRL